jgi:hypothetical protein
MLEVVAQALRSPSAKLIHDGFYQNEHGDWGYYVAIWQAGHYHMISVSHIESVPSSREIANALESSSAYTSDSGRYLNRRGSLGYYATVKSGDHWYMVSVSDMLQPYHKQWWVDRISS